METLLSLKDVAKRHGGRPVLRGVSFDLNKGEVLGLIGENGVGKSTLMSLLAGDYPPDSGQILCPTRCTTSPRPWPAVSA